MCERQHVASAVTSAERLGKCRRREGGSTAKVVRNFFMSLLLWLRLKILQPLALTHRRRLQNAGVISPRLMSAASFQVMFL
jgi:hypothetical protein